MTGDPQPSATHVDDGPVVDPPARAPAILLVEDDASLAQSLQAFLADHGYASKIVGTLREAQLAVTAHCPALCLLDLNLPDGCGLDLLRRLVHDALPTRVIGMTAFPLRHLSGQHPNATVIEWLSKPVAPARLLEQVRSAMEPASSDSAAHDESESLEIAAVG